MPISADDVSIQMQVEGALASVDQALMVSRKFIVKSNWTSDEKLTTLLAPKKTKTIILHSEGGASWEVSAGIWVEILESSILRETEEAYAFCCFCPYQEETITIDIEETAETLHATFNQARSVAKGWYESSESRTNGQHNNSSSRVKAKLRIM